MEELEKYVVSAINKGYITVPITGYEDGQGAKHCLQPYGASLSRWIQSKNTQSI
jgi:hypothetical protein